MYEDAHLEQDYEDHQNGGLDMDPEDEGFEFLDDDGCPNDDDDYEED